MARKLTKQEWRRRRRIKAITLFCTMILLAVAVLAGICTLLGDLLLQSEEIDVSNWFKAKTHHVEPPDINEDFLTVNPYSRPGTKIKKVRGVVIHYTANPGTDAKANRNYFESLKDTQTTYASSHFVVGLDGNVIQNMPLDEIAYASNTRNEDTISIETCHPDSSGKFTKKTYQALVQLTAFICGEYNLKEEDILRHYDVTGKPCPLYYVENEDAWATFKKDVFLYIEKHKDDK